MIIRRNISIRYWIMVISFIVAGVIISGKLPYITSKVQGKTGEEVIETCHPLYNFSIKHPKKWHPQLYGPAGLHGDHDLKLMITNGRLGPIILIYYHASQNPTLEQALNWRNAKMDITSDIDVETQPMTVGSDIKAILAKYRKGNTFVETVTFTRNDGMFLMVFEGSAEAYKNDRENFRNMVLNFGYCEDTLPE